MARTGVGFYPPIDYLKTEGEPTSKMLFKNIQTMHKIQQNNYAQCAQWLLNVNGSNGFWIFTVSKWGFNFLSVSSSNGTTSVLHPQCIVLIHLLSCLLTTVRPHCLSLCISTDYFLSPLFPYPSLVSFIIQFCNHLAFVNMTHTACSHAACFSVPTALPLFLKPAVICWWFLSLFINFWDKQVPMSVPSINKAKRLQVVTTLETKLKIAILKLKNGSH
jgi:hypothetical protein